MAGEQDRNIKDRKKELRKFGATIGVALGVLGGLFLWRGKDCYIYLLVASGVFLSVGMVVPLLLGPVHKVWMSMASLLGWVMTRIILSVLFYLVFTPIGVLVKLFGRNFLDLKFDADADSYWIPRKKVNIKKSDYERQF